MCVCVARTSFNWRAPWRGARRGAWRVVHGVVIGVVNGVVNGPRNPVAWRGVTPPVAHLHSCAFVPLDARVCVLRVVANYKFQILSLIHI